MAHLQWIEKAHEVFDIEIAGLIAVKNQLGNTFVQVIELLATCKGRVVVMGLGKSGLVGKKIAATLSSTGTPAFFLHPVEGAHGDMGSLRDSDIIIAISNSGETEELNAILPAISSLGLQIIAITSNPNSTLAHNAQVTLQAKVDKEACPHNLAPTASTTAVLALGDAIAVCLIHYKDFTQKDFLTRHPGGSIGQRLRHNVHQLMRTENIPAISSSATIQDAILAINNGKIGAVLITDGTKLQGIFTDGDLRRTLCKSNFSITNTIASCMTILPLTAQPEQNVAELLDIMEQKSITVLPVTDKNNTIVGIINLHDILGNGNVRFHKNA